MEHSVPRLPQARMYLKTAQWGFKQLIEQQLSGYAFRLHLVGILAALRAVQHAQHAHDRKLSPQHETIVSQWWNAHRDMSRSPELRFIKQSRDMMLKAGAFSAYATFSESSTGEGSNRVVTATSYELAYYDANHDHHDLAPPIQSALDWCERELTQLEARLPDVSAPEYVL